MSRFTKKLVLGFAILFIATFTFNANLLAAQNKRPYRIVVVTHGQAVDPFWAVVKNGVEQAATDMRVTVEYESPSVFDVTAMAKMIDDAVTTDPDGLVVSIPDPDALGP